MKLKEMYPGIPNSPETKIENDISVQDTVIYVNDANAIPEPPNLLVIGGNDVTAETVKLVGKEVNKLTVERGRQGVAKSWPIGTTIGRNFTEDDYATLVENIKGVNKEAEATGKKVDDIKNELDVVDIDDAVALPAKPEDAIGSFGEVFNWLGGVVKAVTGRAKWWQKPVMSIADISTQMDDIAQGIRQFSKPNLLENGGFDNWKRSTFQNTAGYGSDDRWSNNSVGSIKMHSMQTFVPGQTEVPGNPVYFSRTVVDFVAGTNNGVWKLQRIENVATLSGQTVTLSFWAKADGEKDMAIDWQQNFGDGGSTTINGNEVGKVSLSTQWKKYEVTIEIPSVAGKTIGANSSMQIMFWFDAGSNYDIRTNNLGHQSGTFDLAQVKLEIGNRATPFMPRLPGEELALCQRYYETGVYQADVRPSVVFLDTISYKVSKRISTPTVSILSGFYGAPNSVDIMYNSQWYNIPVTGVVSRDSEFSVQTGALSSALEYYSSIYFTWKSDAEI